MLAQQDGDGVSLLARGATRDPDANWCVGGPALHDPGNDLLGEGLERFGIAEELGHADQEILEQTFRIGSVLLQKFEIVSDRLQVVNLQPAPDATQKRSLFIAAEIVPGALMNERADLAEVGGKLFVEVLRSVSTSEFGEMLCVLGDDSGHLFDRDDVIDQSRPDRTLDHAVVSGGLRRLRQGEAPVLLDSPKTDGAIVASAREENPDGVLALLLGERVEECVDARVGRPLGRHHTEDALVDGQEGTWRDDVDVVRLQRQAIASLEYGHGRVPSKQLGQHTGVIGFEVL